MRGAARWLAPAIVAAILYPVLGVLFGWLANPSASHGLRVGWRLAAWVTAAAVFAAHLAYERFRLGDRPVRVAGHVAAAVALGALLLAVWINLLPRADARPRPRARLALAIFPLVTGLPAFAVAFASLALLDRVRRPGSG